MSSEAAGSNKRRGRRWKPALLPVGVLVLVLGFAYRQGFWSLNGWAARVYSIRGVDVSHHQGQIDWAAVASEGIDFVYIKATEGVDYRDDRFAENWKQTADHRISRGAYHFFTLTTSGQAQAANFVATVPVDPSALPPAVDLEFGGNNSTRPSVAAFQGELDIFLKRLRKVYGKEPVLYTDEEFYTHYLAHYSIRRLWIASILTKPRVPYTHSWLFWQYASLGRVRGIEGPVDLDVFANDARSFEALLREKEAPHAATP